ncbi:Bor family protein [Leptospira noguchii]|uniref:Bor family protein n=1 Tax=Leptospira noguchii TaxID=28182 RepID=UPI001F067EF1|nr:Bor family protein [Leptospira noguchii]MCH1913685.1 Bor family protein [Leptospira noguchii]MCH1915024.1 Bor family protein [Leptospira noguchii]UOG64933.1 Bor family protein [Leptospira noguchii]
MKNILKIKNYKILIFFLAVLFLTECRHAWVRFPQTTPEACQTNQYSNECKRVMEEKRTKREEPGKIYTIHQKYFFFGLLPTEQVVEITKYCPQGPRSAHQFTSFWDAVWEQLTLTIYSPQTLEVECYP